jgi:hypothetical protein
MGPPRAAIPITVPGSRPTNGWPAPGACSMEPNGRRLEVPNRPAAVRPLLPLHRAPQLPFRRTHSPAPRPRPRDPPLTCRPVRLRELQREPPVRFYAATLDARYSASCLEPNSSLAHWIAGLSLNRGKDDGWFIRTLSTGYWAYLDSGSLGSRKVGVSKGGVG